MVCVDTSFVISLERRQRLALEKLQKLEATNDLVYTTAITAAEIYPGAYVARDSACRQRDLPHYPIPGLMK